MNPSETLPKRAAAQALRNYVRGHHGELGDLFAAFDATAHHVEPGVRSSRFAARLAPFSSREDAERALLAEGAVLQ
jgi:hypothetical protein